MSINDLRAKKPQARVEMIPYKDGHRRQITWTDDVVEYIKQQWMDGKSATIIARAIGINSRSAVLGKLNRLGLIGKREIVKKVYRHVRKPRIPQNKTVMGMRQSSQRERIKAALSYDQAINIINKEPDVARVKFNDLQDHHCRYPIGDPVDENFGYCGDQKIAGISYCATHARRCFAVEDPHRSHLRLRVVRKIELVG
jgi:GcrA cell cycle regulator